MMRGTAISCRGGAALAGLALSAGLSAAPPEERQGDKKDDSAAIIITEVLYNVPAGMDGDANGDGNRDAVGDEFVELYNNSDAPVSLRGWTIANRLGARDDDEEDGKKKSSRGVRFTFPAFELPPHGVALVFNGYDASIPSPAGDEAKAPKQASERFGGAWVFTMDNSAKFNAFNNTADFVLVSDKSGRPVECVLWGKPDSEPPASVKRLLRLKAADPKGSMAREPDERTLSPHRKLDGKAFSPGVIAKHDAEREEEDHQRRSREKDDEKEKKPAPKPEE